MHVAGPARGRDPVLELACLLPPDGEYVRVPFVDPLTALNSSLVTLVTGGVVSTTWGPLKTIQIPYAELIARGLIVQVSAVFKVTAPPVDLPATILVSVDSCVNDGGIEMIYGPQLLMLEPQAVTRGAVTGQAWYAADALIVLLRDDPHITPDMVVTISGRALLPQGAPAITSYVCQVAIVAELIADTLFDPTVEATNLLKMIGNLKLDTDDQRPTAKLQELMRRAGVVGSPL